MTKLPTRIHVIGICGVAMSALAIAFHKRGVAVTGSDKGFFPPVSTELEKQGLPFYAGWHPEKMIEHGRPDFVIVGTASGTQNPETAYASEQGITMYSFPEVIGKFFAKENSVICAGTWGKTSSSAMLSFILEKAKMDPSYMFGGVSLGLDSSARLTDSSYSVCEGDEYKSSPTDLRAKFFHYKPTHVLLSAVSWDHADLYPTEALYFDAFKKLLSSLPSFGLIVSCKDNAGTAKIIDSFAGKKITYGRFDPRKDSSPDYSYKDASQSPSGIDFTVTHAGSDFKIHSPMLGLFQIENMTGCFAMAHELGIAPEVIVEAIRSFGGIKRRLEKRLVPAENKNGVTVIDDIAHSGDKAAATLNTLRAIYVNKVIAVFEPNSGGRNRDAAIKYDDAFRDADVVVIPRLTKLKVAENENDKPLDGDELTAIIALTHKDVHYIPDDAKVVDFLTSTAKNGDVIAFLGSHGFRGMIEEVVSKLKKG